jgi:hypothetical protein
MATEDNLAAMEAALRVLAAVTSRRHPDIADVAAIRSYAPDLGDLPPDALACEVVGRVRKTRPGARAQGSGG